MGTARATRIDPVNPAYYKRLKPEPIEVIEAWNLPAHLANVVKYIARWDAKGGIVDLKKASFYLSRYIWYLEKTRRENKPKEKP